MGSGALNRGDVVLFAAGKPRPGVIVQADEVETPVDILICPFSTTIVEASIFRLTVEPNSGNGLRAMCQIMVDKLGAISRRQIDRVVGRLGTDELLRLELALIAILDLGG